MGTFKRFSAIAVLGVTTSVLWGSSAVGADEESKNKDPRIATMQYYGSGNAEHAPDFAEATFNFSVNCRKDPSAVREVIEAESGPIWRAIVAKVPAESFSETNQTKWGDIQNILPVKRGIKVNNPPQESRNPVTGEVTKAPAEVKQYDTCDKNTEVAFDADLGYVFGGNQTFTVRSNDLDWVESLVKQVNKKEPGKEDNSVSFQAYLTPYSLNSLTEATRRAMENNMRDQARTQATGVGSQFELDRDTLGYASARFVGSKRGNAPVYNPEIGMPIARGLAPKVSLTLPITYTMYAETKNLLGTGGEKGAAPSEYEVKGRAILEADYAQTSATVTSRCQATREAAAEALKAPAEEVLAAYTTLHGVNATTETEAVIVGEPTSPSEHYPYVPVAWDEKDSRKVTKYFNECTRETVDAPANGNVRELKSYWAAQQVHSLKTTQYAPLVDMFDGLAALNTADRLAAHVSVALTAPTSAVLPAKSNALWMAARRDANACLRDPQGALAADARANGFVCAYVKNVRVGVTENERPRFRGMARAAAADMNLEAAPMAAAPMALGAGAPDTLQVDVTVKPGEQRARIRLSATYEFTYEVMTTDYVQGLAPQAPATPEVPTKVLP